jgi:hypothetical protein
MPDNTQLRIYVAGSVFDTDLEKLQPWTPLLNSAESIGLVIDGSEAVRVELGRNQRWIAFNRIVSGSCLYVIGRQETVGAIQRGGMFIGGSNRKMLAWLHPSGRVQIE